MRRLLYITALALMAMLVLAPGAMAQQMNHQHMMPNGQMMDDNTMAGSSASASASPSAAATPSAPRSHHHAGDLSSASAAVGGRLPGTGGVSLVSSLVSIGAVALLGGFGLVAARLLRRNL